MKELNQHTEHANEKQAYQITSTLNNIINKHVFVNRILHASVLLNEKNPILNTNPYQNKKATNEKIHCVKYPISHAWVNTLIMIQMKIL